jgi:hypothetical protein
MDDHALFSLVSAELPQACPDCLGVVRGLCDPASFCEHGDVLARRCGYPNRWKLSMALGKHGFPPIHRLHDRLRVLHFLLTSERHRVPLNRQAWSLGLEPSVCHRTVRRVTGLTWNQARQRGWAYWLQDFGASLRRGIRCPNPGGGQ